MGRRALQRHWVFALFLALTAVAVPRAGRAADAARADDAAAPLAALPAGSVLGLDSREPDDTGTDETNPGLLLRELARQAVLIAARDGVGAGTRDQVLREPFPAGALVLSIRTRADRNGLHFWLSRPRAGQAGGQGEGAVLLEKQVPLPMLDQGVIDYAGLAAELEALSRGELVDVLRNAGLKGAARPATAPAPAGVPAAVEAALAELSFPSQFSAVRQAHAAIRAGGESPPLLGALARGYANLGQLTRYHWNASHKAFDARALLYARRAVAAAPASAAAHYDQAYAMAMAGLHARALAESDEADKLARGGPAPAWAALLRASCKYDTGALAAAVAAEHDRGAAGSPTAALAAYLCFVSVESSGSEAAVVGFGQIALDHNPTCARVVDWMADQSGVRGGHVLTELEPRVLAAALESNLRRMPALPARVRQAMPPKPAEWVEAAGAAAPARLVEAGSIDPAEPSWAALGRLVQEAQFAAVWRRAAFVTYLLGDDASEYVQQSMPLVKRHPYANYIESLGRDRQEAPFRFLLSDIDVVDAEGQEYPLMQVTEAIETPGKIQGKEAERKWHRHGDDVAWDGEIPLLQAMKYLPAKEQTNPARAEIARHVEVVSPYMPTALAAEIEADWKSIEPRIAQVERESGAHPAVGLALARQYLRLNRPDDAERCLRRYMGIVPDYEAYQLLAGIQFGRGDEAGWLKTLESFLDQPDYALHHTQARVEIARHFMDKGDYARAEPFAAAAADSGAAWALEAAAQCYEGLGRWEKAEAMLRQDALQYGHAEQWFLWCLRTGHGNLESAAAAAEQRLRGGGAPADPNAARDAVFTRAVLHLVRGKPDEAERDLQPEAAKGDPMAGLYVALLADAAHDAARRDAALKTVVEKGPGFRLGGRELSGPVGLAGSFRQALDRAASTGNRPAIDADAAEKLIGASPADRTNCLYFVGRFLQVHGQGDAARGYYARCVEGPDRKKLSYALTAWRLREMGADAKAAAGPRTKPG